MNIICDNCGNRITRFFPFKTEEGNYFCEDCGRRNLMKGER